MVNQLKLRNLVFYLIVIIINQSIAQRILNIYEYNTKHGLENFWWSTGLW